MGKLFGTDGVRGVAGVELTSELATNIGIATAIVLTKNKKDITIVIGSDTRISKDMLVSSLISGLTSVGVNIIDLGVIPTPAVSYLVKEYQANAGIMVSASHNPSEYNGIKIFDKDGYKLPDELENEIEEIIDNISNYKTNSNKTGHILTGYNPIEDYVNHLVDSCKVKLNKLNIAVDCANGSASSTAELLFKKLNCNATILNHKPDGLNINDNCGSTHIEGLVDYVLKHKLDCGIAYDGDADRCIMVDSTGKIIDGDFILAISSQYLKENNKLKNNTVVGTVMSNLGLIKYCEDNKINFTSTKVGDRYVLEEMLQKDYIIGGEQSGHIIFKDYANTGDGELTSLKVLEIMSSNNKSLHDLSNIMEKYPQVLINVEINNEKKNNFNDDNYLKQEINKISTELGNDYRVLVRPSGTEPLIRVMIEGKDTNIIEKKAKSLAKLINNRLK